MFYVDVFYHIMSSEFSTFLVFFLNPGYFQMDCKKALPTQCKALCGSVLSSWNIFTAQHNWSFSSALKEVHKSVPELSWFCWRQLHCLFSVILFRISFQKLLVYSEDFAKCICKFWSFFPLSWYLLFFKFVYIYCL